MKQAWDEIVEFFEGYLEVGRNNVLGFFICTALWLLGLWKLADIFFGK